VIYTKGEGEKGVKRKEVPPPPTASVPQLYLLKNSARQDYTGLLKRHGEHAKFPTDWCES